MSFRFSVSTLGSAAPAGASRAPSRRFSTRGARSRSGLHLVVAALLLASAAGIGCSRQSEGSRCSLLNGNADCQEGLECVPASALRSRDGVDRCCPPTGDEIESADCTPRIVSGGNGGDGMGGAGVGGAGGAGPEPSTRGVGESCTLNSECAPGLVCSIEGRCQQVCLTTRDCPDDLVCSDNLVCESE